MRIERADQPFQQPEVHAGQAQVKLTPQIVGQVRSGLLGPGRPLGALLLIPVGRVLVGGGGRARGQPAREIDRTGGRILRRSGRRLEIDERIFKMHLAQISVELDAVHLQQLDVLDLLGREGLPQRLLLHLTQISDGHTIRLFPENSAGGPRTGASGKIFFCLHLKFTGFQPRGGMKFARSPYLIMTDFELFCNRATGTNPASES